MVVGTPGGSTITSVLQTILNVSEFNMSMQEATHLVFIINGFQTRLPSNQTLLTKAYWQKVKAKDKN
jgi:gamma-glutamyltranspeptidase